MDVNVERVNTVGAAMCVKEGRSSEVVREFCSAPRIELHATRKDTQASNTTEEAVRRPRR